MHSKSGIESSGISERKYCLLQRLGNGVRQLSISMSTLTILKLQLSVSQSHWE